MEFLLPLMIVIPLGAAFLIPMVHLVVRKPEVPGARTLALVAAAALVLLSLATFAEPGTLVAWIGGHQGGKEVLGLAGRPVTPEEVEGLPGRGVLVEHVAAYSAAGEAGIEEGDVLLGQGSLNELRRRNAAQEPGEPGSRLALSLWRDGQTVEVTLAGGRLVTGIAMVCDGLTRLMLVVVAVVSFAAILFSLSYMEGFTKLHLYYSPLMLMIAGMTGIVVSGDLFNIYVFLEVAAVASYALVGFGVESEELEASFKYLVLSAVASGSILLGIGIIYSLSGTLNLAQIAEYTQRVPDNDALWLALGFFVAGFGLKAAMVPFHAWLPDAHPSAPAPVSAMLSGLLIKASGVYVLARLVFNVFGPSVSSAYVLMTMGALSMIVGVFLAVGQWDFKRLLAYHSISQMGYVVLALGVGAEVLARGPEMTENWGALASLAVFAGLFHLVNHAAFKSLLFLSAGSVVHRTGTRDLKELGGMGRPMPWTSRFARIGALSISGVPPFNGFFSKLLIIIAVVWAGHWLLGAVTALVSFMTLLSFTKVQRYLIEGETPSAFAQVRESPLPMQVAMAILAVACIGLGVLLPLYGAGLLRPAAESLFYQINGYVSSVFLGG